MNVSKIRSNKEQTWSSSPESASCRNACAFRETFSHLSLLMMLGDDFRREDDELACTGRSSVLQLFKCYRIVSGALNVLTLLDKAAIINHTSPKSLSISLTLTLPHTHFRVNSTPTVRSGSVKGSFFSERTSD